MSLRLPKAFTLASTKSKSKITPRYVPVHANSTLEDSLETKSINNLNQGINTFDAEKDQSLIQALDYKVWLPFAAKTYNISPNIEDYVLINTLVCPSDIPNRNGIGFPVSELATFLPPPTNRMAYKAWVGCPVHLEHANEHHEDAYGIVLDASLHKVLGYGGGKLWKVMGLLAVDKNKNPDIAQQILDKEINTYSMGAMVDYFTCSYCGTECTEKYVCHHITSPKVVNWRVVKDYDGSSHVAYLDAHGIQPIEVSIVKDPAWAPALSNEVFQLSN